MEILAMEILTMEMLGQTELEACSEHSLFSGTLGGSPKSSVLQHLKRLLK